jgi:hypothetical protein
LNTRLAPIFASGLTVNDTVPAEEFTESVARFASEAVTKLAPVRKIVLPSASVSFVRTFTVAVLLVVLIHIDVASAAVTGALFILQSITAGLVKPAENCKPRYVTLNVNALRLYRDVRDVLLSSGFDIVPILFE